MNIDWSSSLVRFVRDIRVDELDGLVASSLSFFSIASLDFLSSSSCWGFILHEANDKNPLCNSYLEKIILLGINSKVYYLSCNVLGSVQLKINVIVHKESFAGSIMISEWSKSACYLKIIHKRTIFFHFSIFWMNANYQCN